MRLLVTGSRNWGDTKLLWDTLDELTEGVPPGTLVEGAAAGADNDAYLWALVNGWTPERHPASDFRHPLMRNRHMVSLGADLCVAFIRNHSRGASFTADLAAGKGIRTVRIERND